MWNPKTLAGAGAAALSLTFPQSSLASLLYVTSYAGTLTTLNLTLPASNASTGTLQAIATNDGCKENPSWLTLDYARSTLYCLDEGFDSPNGTLSSYKTNPNGTLTQLAKVKTASGPVSGVLYGEGGRGIVLAEYSGSSMSSFLSDPSSLKELQSVTWNLSHPGANPSRQEAPHPHEAILDPTGEFIILPDLGADLIRMFAINQTSLEWTPIAPYVTPPGSGPRHAAFLVTGNKTFLYTTSELANTVTGYEVTYNANKTLTLSQIYLSGSHGLNNTVPSGATAAEVHLTPDNKFLIVSSRGESSFSIPNFDPKNSTQIVSDSLITFAIDHATGALGLVQRFPSGGMIPRQFSINKAGTLVGVGLQGDGRVVVIGRDLESGKMTDFVATADIPGQVTCVVFDE